MADIEKPDICIIGAGALGRKLAIRARQLGRSVLLIDRGAPEVGDPPQGDMAVAALAATAARAQDIRTADALGLAKVEPKLSFKAIAERAGAVVATLAPEHAPERLTAVGVDYRRGAPVFTGPAALQLGDTSIRADQFILATGASPTVPDLPGLSRIKYFTPDTIADNARKLTHLLVIGGDAVALELAQIHRRLGCEVTLVAQGPMLAGFDPELTAIVLRQLAGEGVTLHPGALVQEIQPRRQGTGVVIGQADGTSEQLDVSHVLVALGRVPQLDSLGLDKARIRLDAAGVLIRDAAGRTTNRRVAAIGGAASLAPDHAAYRQGLALLGRGKITALQISIAQTRPQLAQLGPVTEAQAGDIVLRTSLAHNAAAIATAAPEGLVKLTVSSTGTIVSAALAGTGAADLAAILALAIDRGLTAADLADLPLPEPSLAATLTVLGEQYLAQRPPKAPRFTLPKLAR